MTLSKSQYIRGLQCHKSLWLYKNRPELRSAPDYAQESLFNTGHSVGALAKELFPDGVCMRGRVIMIVFYLCPPFFSEVVDD